MTDLKIRNIKKSLSRFLSKNRRIYILFTGLILTCMLFSSQVKAQETKKIDKIKAFFSEKGHSAKKATVYSAILPGWGQAYNRKYWKIPIVYAGFAGVGYFIKTNHDQYKLYKSYYQLMKDDPDYQPVENKTIQQIRIDIDDFRRNRDLSIIGMAAWYGLGLIDANVDGHFFNYDVSEDLSLSLKPRVFSAGGIEQGLGVSINLRWR